MRKWCGPFLSAAMVLGLAVPSFAEPANFSATFELKLGSFAPFQAIQTGTLDATIAGGAVTAFTLPVSTFKLAKVTPVAPPITVVAGVKLTGVSVGATLPGVKGSFDQTSGKAPSVGDSKLFFNGKGTLTATIPLDDAIGTTATIKTKLLGLVPMTLAAKKWTVGKATLTTVPLGGGAPAKITRTGAFDGAGSFTFISPTQITIAAGSPPSKIASFGTLAIDIQVPEAANVLLLATGAAVMLLVGYRRSAA
jgi:hypothetical protein